MRQGKNLLQSRSTFITLLCVRNAFACILLVAFWSVGERSQASDVSQPYNLLLGPVTVRADADLTGSFNDNIRVSQMGRLADFIINPSVGIHGLWQASEMNALTFDIGVGYELYTFHSQYDYVTISPDSQISFNMLVGDIKVNLHDNFSYQQDPLLVGQLSNTNRFPTFTNDAGVGLSWDLNEDIILSSGYDHINYMVLDDPFTYLDYQEDSLTPQFTYKINPTINAGISTSLSDTRYDKNIQNDNTSVSGGPFVKAQFTDQLSVNAQAGYIYTTYSGGGLNGASENINSYYGSVGVTHKINEAFTESFTGGKDYLPGLASNYTQRTYANYTIGWQLSTAINLSANLSAENLKDSNGNIRTANLPTENLGNSSVTTAQTSNRFQSGLNLDYTLSTHATLSLNYQYTLKDSDVSDLSFYQNVITAGCRYRF